MADKEESKEVALRDADFFDTPFNGGSTALALKDDSSMDSMRVIFEEIRDGINTLVDLTMNMGPSAADLRDQNLGDSDVGLGDTTPADTGGGFKVPEMPKIGPKVGMLLMLAGLTLLFEYGDVIAKAIEPVLKLAKSFTDKFGIKGALYTGLALVAAVKLGGPLLTLLGAGAKGISFAFGLLKDGFTLMKDAVTAMPGLIKSAYTGGKNLVMGAFTKLAKGFQLMRLFLIEKAYPAILSAFGGIKGKLFGAITKLGTAFTAMRTFLMVTMIPSITAMMGPFLIPLALLVGAVALAVAVFVSIKKGIDDFKKSLDEGDSMLVAIIEGVSTALLTLVTLPITLIKDFAAWALKKLGFEDIAKKLKDIDIVDAIKTGIKTLFDKAKKFILGLFDIDFNAVMGKFVDIGKSIMLSIKAIGAGALGAAKGFLSPVKNFKKAYNAYMEKNKLPDEVAEIEVENEEDYKKNIRNMDDVRKEELIENKEKLDELAYMDPDKVLESGNDVEGEIMELEMRNDALYEMIGDKLDTSNEIAIENAKIMMSIANSAPTPVIINNNNKTENNQNDNTSIVSDIAVDHQDKTADALANSN